MQVTTDRKAEQRMGQIRGTRPQPPTSACMTDSRALRLAAALSLAEQLMSAKAKFGECQLPVRTRQEAEQALFGLRRVARFLFGLVRFRVELLSELLDGFCDSRFGSVLQ